MRKQPSLAIGDWRFRYVVVGTRFIAAPSPPPSPCPVARVAFLVIYCLVLAVGVIYFKFELFIIPLSKPCSHISLSPATVAVEASVHQGARSTPSVSIFVVPRGLTELHKKLVCGLTPTARIVIAHVSVHKTQQFNHCRFFLLIES